MYHPIEFEMAAKIHNAELLKEAAEHRAARVAQGDADQPVARWWMAALSLAVVAVGLVMLASML